MNTQVPLDIGANLAERIGARMLYVFDQTGQLLLMFLETLFNWRYALGRYDRTATQLVRVGNQSLPIAAAMAVFTGMVLALHSGYALRQYGSENLLASIVALSMVKEMSPVLTGMLLAGRIGAAFTAEIGTMRVNEEIDALETLGINPVRYLCVPRLAACLVMMPALVVYSDVVGILGGAAVASASFELPLRSYFDEVFRALAMRDISEGLVKGVVFGLIIANIACHRGLRTRGGASGVGTAITHCVVDCFVWIFVANYFVTQFFVSAFE
jgi:phospholipid/cholesterol/gamma-HCH transport system permease protein